ncbi:hypothetical protein [Cellvibrio polysaccharolyticus]|uniref:hypothetical protein n=1 Tax=Cellvibrio polysaccharolyticus TaxID=2082724 RepID=UPI0018804530|nr:hypothetical protein [Cellvibrio polysaccharolyticus]
MLMIYHARDYKGLQGTPLTDPNRHIYVRRLHGTADGMPDSGSITVTETPFRIN